MRLSLGPLVVLIGANGSGKSNILDVLRLTKEIVVDGTKTTQALEKRGGYGEVVWGGEKDRGVSIELRWGSGGDGIATNHTYGLGLAYDKHNDVIVTDEDLTTSQGDGLRRPNGSPFEYTLAGEGVVSGGAPTVISAVSGVGFDKWPRPGLIDSMRRWAFYRFNPALMRGPQPVRDEYRLAETGENLSTVVHALFSASDPAMAEIVDLLRACVPTVKELQSPIVGEAKTAVALREEAVPKAVGSWGLSDGTLLALALATALMTPDPPSLLLLEAPDIELHPYVMETLAEMLKLASTKTQVIATTHSPYLLNFLPAESFVVVEKAKGATVCKPVKGRQGLLKAVEALGAGEAWYAGHIGGAP